MASSEKKPEMEEIQFTNEAPAEETEGMDAPDAAQESSMETALRARILELEDEAKTLRDQWVRAVAEADNIRKRAQREQEDTSRYAITSFARDMVNVLENLKRASESLPPQSREGNDLLKNLGEGVDLTLQELLSIFERYGIQRIDPLKQKFDHNLHQAVVQVETNEAPPGTVVQVVQAGYIIHGRLLRPAMVAVSKQPQPTQPMNPVDTTA